MPTEFSKTQYDIRAKLVFLFALLLLVYRFLSHALLSQLNAPPYVFIQSEWIYRFLQLSGLPAFVTSHSITAITFDILLFLFPALFLLTRQRKYAVLFLTFMLFYFLTFNLATGHHYHSLAGLLIILLPFCVKRNEVFDLLWQSCRYYLFYIFSSAALWKLFRGAAFYTDQLSTILKSQHLDFLLQQPDSIHAHFIRYLISHPQTAHAVLWLAVLLQLSFFIGFFTKRFDTLLLILFVLFVIANYWVMSIVSAELLLLGITLLSNKQLERIGDFIPWNRNKATPTT